MPTPKSAIDQPATTRNLNFSPKQMEVATQLVGLHCLPAAQSDTQECAPISGKTAKDAVLEAMKEQFYNVYGQSINKDILRTQDSASTSSSLVVTKDQYDKIVQALQLYPTTKKKEQFMKNCFNRFSLGSNLEDNCLFRKVVIKPTNGSNDSPGVKLKKVIWYEKFLDIIHETHILVSHPILQNTQDHYRQ
jgi:hypothetical protein